MWKHLYLLLAAWILSLPNISQAQQTYTASFFNRAWWQSKSEDQQREYLAGYTDCAVTRKVPHSRNDTSWYTVAPAITKFYTGNPDSTLNIVDLLGGLKFPPVKEDLAAEVYKDKHGFFDGQYWAEMDRKSRMGFIEGYLTCRFHAAGVKRATSQAASWYVSKIDAMYGVSANKNGNSQDAKAIEIKMGALIETLTPELGK